MDGVVVWLVKMLSNGESTVLVPLMLMVSFHLTEVLTKSVCEPTTSFCNVLPSHGSVYKQTWEKHENFGIH